MESVGLAIRRDEPEPERAFLERERLDGLAFIDGMDTFHCRRSARSERGIA